MAQSLKPSRDREQAQPRALLAGRKRAPRDRHSVRTDSGPIALRAFWSMHVEAMNFNGLDHAEYAAALGLSPHALRIWRDRLEESGEEMDWRSCFIRVPGLNQAALLIARGAGAVHRFISGSLRLFTQ